MARQQFVEPLVWATSSGTAIASSTAETIIVPDTDLPAKFMQDGRLLRIRAMGQYSTTGTPTLTFRIRWGGVGGTLLCASAACTTPSGVLTALWEIDALIQSRSNGASGTLMANGHAIVHAGVAGTVASTTGNALVTPMTKGGVITPAVASVDLTAAAALSITAAWSASDALNTLTGLNLSIEAVN